MEDLGKAVVMKKPKTIQSNTTYGQFISVFRWAEHIAIVIGSKTFISQSVAGGIDNQSSSAASRISYSS